MLTQDSTFFCNLFPCVCVHGLVTLDSIVCFLLSSVHVVLLATIFPFVQIATMVM